MTGAMGPAAPSWLERLPVGCWVKLSGDAPDLDLTPTPPGTRYLADQDPARDPRLNPARSWRERLRRAAGRPPLAPWSGRCGFSAVTEAWNGAAYAPGLGASGAMVVFGGGHDDYFGADVHRFDLATREWSRLCDGYVTGGPAEYGAGAVYPLAEYPDGSPLPPHTHNYLQCDPQNNTLVLFKGQLELGPQVRAVAIPHMLDLATRRWRRGPGHPWAILNAGGCTAWDTRRKVVWGHAGDAGGGNALLALDPGTDGAGETTGRWVSAVGSRFAGRADGNAMVHLPVPDRLLVAVAADGSFSSLDPADPAAPARDLARPAAAPRVVAHASLEYAPSLGAAVYFGAASSPAPLAIELPGAAAAPGAAWTARSLLAATNGLDPVAEAAAAARGEVHRHHVFGRFRIASFGEVDVAVLVRHVDSPVYALRLPAG